VRQKRASIQPPVDERLLAAMPKLPGCAGVALGVDRLLMAMLGRDAIADVVAFPFDRA
jgi:lysyl-tRNA synthetase class 2